MYIQLQNQKDIIIETMKKSQSLIHSFIQLRKEQLPKLKESTVKESPISDSKSVFKENKPSLLRIFNQEENLSSKNFNKKELKSILKHYKDITGLIISQLETNLFKIEVNYCTNGENRNGYLVLYYHNHLYEIKEIFPNDIDYEPYLMELNLTEDRALFLSKLILNEYINNTNK